MEPLRLFVYGTLKRGFPARERYLSGNDATGAVIRGNIYSLSAGYPAITVPKEDVAAVGTSDCSSDLRLQTSGRLPDGITFDGALIHGEIAWVRDLASIRAIDDYESFDPSRPDGGLYRRVLIPACTSDSLSRITLVWTYVMDAPEGALLPDGVWSGP